MSFAEQPAPQGATKIDHRAGENKPYVYQPYPGCRYHPDGRVVTVQNEAEDKALGSPWAHTPYPPVPKVDPPAEPTLDELKQSHLDLIDRHAGLETLVQDLRKENEDMRAYIQEQTNQQLEPKASKTEQKRQALGKPAKTEAA